MSAAAFERFAHPGEPKQLAAAYGRDGFLVIEGFYSRSECAALRRRMGELVDGYDIAEHKTVFSADDQQHAQDEYFRTSGDKIRFFLEPGALNAGGKLACPKLQAINKVGHALHDLDDAFSAFSRKPALAQLAATLGLAKPLLLQSMYIFKQARHGAAVHAHQDSTFLYTEPQSCVGFWVALEDAMLDNGCLWATPGGHREPLRSRFRRSGGSLQMRQMDPAPLAPGTTPLEAPEGTLVVLHGRLPHNSGPNSSAKTRQAYALHCISGECAYPDDNWLQRGKNMPLRGFTG